MDHNTRLTLSRLRASYDHPQQIAPGFAKAVTSAPSTGLILEFGVATGTSFRQLCQIASPRMVYGFDWFYGLPEHWNADNPIGKFSTKGVPPRLPSNGEIFIGLVQQTLDDFLKSYADDVAFAHLDLDLYSSTKYVLDRLEPRIIDGTVLLFDEIVDNPDHEEKAFLEFLVSTGCNFEVVTKRHRDAIAFRIRR